MSDCLCLETNAFALVNNGHFFTEKNDLVEIGHVSTENDTQINTFVCNTDHFMLRAIGIIVDSAEKKNHLLLLRRAIGKNIDWPKLKSLTLRVFASLIFALLLLLNYFLRKMALI